MVRPIVRLKGRAELSNGREAKWTGSGVVVYSEPNETKSGFDTYVLTCNHCVEVPIFDETKSSEFGLALKGFKYEVDYIQIFNPDNTSRKVMGFVVGQTNNNVFAMNDDGDLVVKTDDTSKDPETGQGAGDDLALIRLNTIEKIPSVKMMPRSKIDDLRLFYKARVVGCSLGGKPYHTFGEITVLENGYMSVNAQFVPGNSGGACYLDETHEFIGITNAGPDTVWHMGLIRPLKRIYDWLDKTNHGFIYDRTISSDNKFATIASDRDNEVFANRTEKRALQAELKLVKRQLEMTQKNLNEEMEKVKMQLYKLEPFMKIRDLFRLLTIKTTKL